MDRTGRRMIKTVLLALVYFAMGLFAEISGPTLSDLKLLYKTNYESLTRAMAGRSIGGIIGALLGGALVDRYEDQSDVLFSLLIAMVAVATLYTPLATTVEAIWYAYFALGLAGCIINMLSTRLVLKIWEERNSTVLQLMLMVYGIGALLIPLICSPFLTKTENLQGRDDGVPSDVTFVHVPFMLVSAYLFLLSVLYLTSHFRWNRNASMKNASGNARINAYKTWGKYLNPGTYANGNFQFGTVVLVFMFVYYSNYPGCEKIFGNFIRALSLDTFHLSKNEASYINTIFWCSFSIGRLTVTVLTRYMTTETLLTTNVILHFGCVWLMENYAIDSLEVFRMFVFMEGFLMGPLFGLVISYCNTMIEVKGVCLTVIVIAGSLGQWFYVNLAGTTYDKHGPMSVLRLISIPACLLVMTVFVLVTFSSRKKKTAASVIYRVV